MIKTAYEIGVKLALQESMGGEHLTDLAEANGQTPADLLADLFKGSKQNIHSHLSPDNKTKDDQVQQNKTTPWGKEVPYDFGEGTLSRNVNQFHMPIISSI